MVPSAQRGQVVQVRQPTVGPVLNVVHVRELRVAAPRKTAALVPPLDLHALHHRRITPNPALVEDRPIAILDREVHVGIAGQTPYDLRRHGTDSGDLRHALRRTAHEQFQWRMDHDPWPDRRSSRPTAPRPEQIQQRVVQPLVVRCVTNGVGPRRRPGNRLRRHPPHQNGLGNCVVVLGERHPNGPSRVVEPQRPALELPDRRPTDPFIAVRSAARSARPSPSPSPSPRPRPSRRFRLNSRLHLRSMPRHQLTRLSHAPMRRRLPQGGIARRRRHRRQRLHQIQGQRSRCQPVRQTRQGFEIRRRPHPLPSRRRADPALPGHPGDHGDGAVPPPSLGSIELGDVSQLLPMQRRDPRRPPHDLPRQLLRAGIATEVPARRPAPQRPVSYGRMMFLHQA